MKVYQAILLPALGSLQACILSRYGSYTKPDFINISAVLMALDNSNAN